MPYGPDKKVDSQFGHNLCRLRKKRGLSQAELGRKAGVSGTDICQYETYGKMPTMVTLKKLADALEVTTWQLTTEVKLNGWIEDALLHCDWTSCTIEDIARTLAVNCQTVKNGLERCRRHHGVKISYKPRPHGPHSAWPRPEVPERDLPYHDKHVDLHQCRDCGYRYTSSGSVICQYILVTGRVRPAPVDGICYCKIRSARPFPCSAAESTRQQNRGGGKHAEKRVWPETQAAD